jgi:hypothetical protein
MLQFDWKNLPQNDFKRWLLVNLLASDPGDRDLIAELSELTDHYTNVEVTMQINGVEIDANKFFGYVEYTMDQRVEHGIKQIVEETPELDEFAETVRQTDKELAAKLREIVKTNFDIDVRTDND